MQHPLPKISIVTPSLNQGRFIRDCIASIRQQNWPNIEHFVIDGGSTDETLHILREHEGQITRWISEPDKGAADAINKGLAMCTGDIVAWLNADDYYLPSAFTEVSEAWRAAPDAPFWFGNGERVDEAGKFKASFNARPMRYNKRALVEGTDYILQPSTFTNSKALQKVGELDTSLRWSFDWELFIRLSEYGQPVALERMLSATREWGETLTSTGSLRRVEEIRLMIENRTGKPFTFGTLCYLFDTMLREMQARPEDFSAQTIGSVASTWRMVQRDMMSSLPVNAGGMPTTAGGAEEETKTKKPPNLFKRTARRGLRVAERLLGD